jgi:hypothetical protein
MYLLIKIILFMSRVHLLRRRLWAVGICLTLLAGATWAVSPDQAQKLKGFGLSAGTLELIETLERQAGQRTRPPVMTVDEVARLAKEGLEEDLIALLLRLDLASGQTPSLTVTPAAVQTLKKEGVPKETIQRLLEGEIKNYSKLTDTDLGRSIVTRPDGSRVRVYQVGDPDRPRPSPKDQEAQDLERALKILERLNIYLKPPQPEKPAD